MVPRQAKLGRSFLGAGKYYLHDVGATTSERVTFTHVENALTQNPEKALKVMAWTAIHAEQLKCELGADGRGRPCEKPVFAFSLSWRPDQESELHKWKMIDAGRRALTALGLEEHETVMVGHSDSAPHVHVIVNTVHPVTGKVNNLSFSKLRLSKWAEDYEREHGQILCEQRVENNKRRAQGEFVKYQEPELDIKSDITRIYHASDSPKAFQEALAAAGYCLAQGKRIVVIDPSGKIHSLARQIEGARAKDIRTKLSGLQLRSVDEERAEPVQDRSSPAPANDAHPISDVRQSHTPEQQPAAPSRAGAAKVFRSVKQKTDSMGLIRSWVAGAGAPPPPPMELNSLQNRQLNEAGEFGSRNLAKRARLEAKLEAFYGAHERALREEIASLEATLKKSGRIRRAWLSLTGQIPHNAEEKLRNKRLSIESIESRNLFTEVSLNSA